MVDKLRRKVNSYRKLVSRFQALVEEVSATWMGGVPAGQVLGIAPDDFGPYVTWVDKTSDSTYFEKVILARHLPSYNPDLGVQNSQFFPGFLGLFREGVDDGVAAWLLRGMDSSFPTGQIAYKGYRTWYYRCIDLITQLDTFHRGLRALVWPKEDESEEELSSEGAASVVPALASDD